MDIRQLKTPFFLSVLATFLAAVASAWGLLGDLYRDNTLVTAAYRGNDLVTLVVVVPLVIVSLIFAARGSQRWLLVWLGCLSYLLYNYIFYMYGAVFNPIFLVYVAIVAVSLWGLILGLAQVDAEQIRRNFNDRTPVKWISCFMLLIPVIIGGIEISQVVGYFSSGIVPTAITQTGHPTGVVYATDLGFLMPAIVVGAVLLWKRRPWGYVLGMIVMIKGVTYPLALVAMSLFSLKAGTGADALTPIYLFFFAGSSVALGLLLKHMDAVSQTISPAAAEK